MFTVICLDCSRSSLIVECAEKGRGGRWEESTNDGSETKFPRFARDDKE
jgi:hypothetical protein